MTIEIKEEYKIKLECRGMTGKEIIRIVMNNNVLYDDLKLTKKIINIEENLDKPLENFIITYKNGDILYPDRKSTINIKQLLYNNKNILPNMHQQNNTKILPRARLNQGMYMVGGDYEYRV
jgi:hypothetical protein